MMRRMWIAIAIGWIGCGTPTEPAQMDEPATDELAQGVGGAVLRQRTDLIKSLSAQKGITNPLLMAAVGFAESGLAQCLAEYSGVACPGPASGDCGGGAVLAGGADGVCGNRDGGLGMYQFDNGNYDQTIAFYGSGILTVSGNASRGIDTILDKVWISTNTPFWNTRAEMLAWINSIRIPSAEYETWLQTMAIYYNGCGCSAARERYRQGGQILLDTFGAAYWSGGSPPPPPPPPAVPPVPVGLTPSGVTLSTAPVFLQWQPSAGATFYIINTLHQVGSSWVNDAIDARANGTSFAISAPPAAPHAWKARACNATGCSADSNWVFFTYAPPVVTRPAVPVGHTPSGVVVRTAPVFLQWQPVSGAGWYVVNTLHQVNGTWVNDAIDVITSAPSFTITSPFLAPYAWKSRACNSAGCSADSNWVFFTFSL